MLYFPLFCKYLLYSACNYLVTTIFILNCSPLTQREEKCLWRFLKDISMCKAYRIIKRFVERCKTITARMMMSGKKKEKKLYIKMDLSSEYRTVLTFSKAYGYHFNPVPFWNNEQRRSWASSQSSLFFRVEIQNATLKRGTKPCSQRDTLINSYPLL